jgi:hypothetical protein
LDPKERKGNLKLLGGWNLAGIPLAISRPKADTLDSGCDVTISIKEAILVGCKIIP